MIAAMNKSLDILKYQLTRAMPAAWIITRRKPRLAAAAATLPPLIKQDAQLKDQLAVLVGRYPSEQPAKNLDLATLKLPEDIPVSLPSNLVEQRPDVLQAEANLHSASAQIGVAIANRLPNLTLAAQAGSSALVFNQLFSDGTDFWNAGGDTWPPHCSMATRSITPSRRPAPNYEQSAAEQYPTVLTRLPECRRQPDGAGTGRRGLKAAAAADDAAKATLDITQYQLKDGYNNTWPFCRPNRPISRRISRSLQAEASRYADTAALFQALGGGWWHRTDLGEANAK